MKLFTKKRQTHRLKNKFMFAEGERWWGGINWQSGINNEHYYNVIFLGLVEFLGEQRIKPANSQGNQP